MNSKSRKPKNQSYKRPKKVKELKTLTMPKEKFDEALKMLNSEQTHFDQTPAAFAHRLPSPPPPLSSRMAGSTRKMTTIKLQNITKAKCQMHIKRFEQNLLEDRIVCPYQLPSLARLFTEMQVCLQNEDWKHLTELILHATDTMYGKLFHRITLLKYAFLAVVYDPLIKRTDLTESFIQSVLNCADDGEIEKFLELMSRQSNGLWNCKSILKPASEHGDSEDDGDSEEDDYCSAENDYDTDEKLSVKTEESLDISN